MEYSPTYKLKKKKERKKIGKGNGARKNKKTDLVSNTKQI